jgi:hypothetical protein
MRVFVLEHHDPLAEEGVLVLRHLSQLEASVSVVVCLISAREQSEDYWQAAEWDHVRYNDVLGAVLDQSLQIVNFSVSLLTYRVQNGMSSIPVYPV